MSARGSGAKATERWGVRAAAWTGMALCALVAGCATGGVSSQSENHWREDMGRVNQATLETALDKIVRKHALQIARTQRSSREIYYETIWVEREVLADEEAQGVSHARNRIVLRGHRLEASMGGGSVYRVTWEVENEVSSALAEGWHPDVIPAEVVEGYRSIYSDLMLEVRTGLIR